MERKQKILNFLSDESYPPVNIEEMMLMLDIPFDDREELMVILDELAKENLIIKTSKKKYASPQKLGFLVGTVSLARGGFGFLVTEGRDDVFIPPNHLMGAFDGDTVMATLSRTSAGAEARVTKVIARKTCLVVGTFQNSRSFGFVVPDNSKIPDIFISKKKFKNAKDGQKVVAKITKFADMAKPSSRPEGEIAEILGYPSQKGVDILSVIRSHGIRDVFPERVLEQCANIDDTISDADIAARRDFRSKTVITIDGADSRDFDDAIGIEYSDGVYTLYVHIADVTHYVTENSPLDKEAFSRGTSVYFPGSVVPMLPPELSNGICSLNPDEDRLTLSVVIKLDDNAGIIEHDICEGVICSKHRMTYDEVTAILDGDRELCRKYGDILKELELMKSLSSSLRSKRMSQGSIDFDFPETKIVTDSNGSVTDVYKYKSGVSNKIIEEFMLLANRVVAEEFFWADIPFVYRIHEKPTTEKIRSFNEFARNMGLKLTKSPHPGEFAKIISSLRGKREEMIVSKVMLRSLMKAKYSKDCLGHFGLSFKYYCHFTSPIRRYPDLAVHRIIKEFMRGVITEKRARYYSKFVAEAAARATETEVIAMEAEREADDIKKAEYMHSRLGETFEATISSCTGFGFYAELENGIEGLVRLSSLRDDYYIFSEKDLSLAGEHTGRRFAIGDSITVKVVSADTTSGNIDFELGD